jgi:hypothetical protein
LAVGAELGLEEHLAWELAGRVVFVPGYGLAAAAR